MLSHLAVDRKDTKLKRIGLFDTKSHKPRHIIFHMDNKVDCNFLINSPSKLRGKTESENEEFAADGKKYEENVFKARRLDQIYGYFSSIPCHARLPHTIFYIWKIVCGVL